MRKTIQNTAQGIFWTTCISLVVIIPQLICHLIGAPVIV